MRSNLSQHCMWNILHECSSGAETKGVRWLRFNCLGFAFMCRSNSLITAVVPFFPSAAAHLMDNAEQELSFHCSRPFVLMQTLIKTTLCCFYSLYAAIDIITVILTLNSFICLLFTPAQ